MKLVGKIFIVFFAIAFFLFMTSSDELMATSIIGIVFMAFGGLSLSEEIKASGKYFYKNPMLLYTLLFIVLGAGLAGAPLIIKYKDVIENFFGMEIWLIISYVIMCLMILAGLFFFTAGLQRKEEEGKSNGATIIGLITVVIFIIIALFLIFNR